MAIQRAAAPPPPAAKKAQPFALKIGKPPRRNAQRIVLYGPGGIGKTSLAALAPGPVAFFDLDESLGLLNADAQAVEGVGDWAALRAALQAPGWDGVKTVVVDTGTAAEEWATDWVLAHVRHEKGHAVSRIEDYGFGKGYTHSYQAWLCLLADLDQHVRAGRNVVLVCHDCTANVPNPEGDDYIRYEPRLQSPASGKASIRYRVREWADHLLFIGYDIVAEDRKAQGSGTRTIYPIELPHCMAKSRTLADPVPYGPGDDSIWRQIFKEA